MSPTTPKRANILVVDDDPLVRYSLRELLHLEGYPVKAAEDGKAALEMFARTPFDVAIIDINMPELNGFDLLKEVKEKYPDTVVILITGYGTIEDAVNGIKLGAYEYITKPLNDDEVKISIERALEQKNLKFENIELKKRLAEKFQFDSIVANHKEMQKIFNLISAVADTEATILINGASGTGKSTIARLVHHHSHRKDRPLVEISCGALSENLLESELFGHVKGAFTTALNDKMGKIEKAEGGTVFLDEIDTLSLRLQVKLLRFLQDRKFERVGSTETMNSNVRVVAAANRDLAQCVDKGEFREDLYYRLNVVSVRVPLLKEHLSDIPLLVDHFLAKYNRLNSKSVKGVSPEVMKRFLSWSWPGNIREVENTIERAVILCNGEHVTYDLLPDCFHEPGRVESSDGLVPLQIAIDSAEKIAIAKTLQHFKGNRNKTAEFLEVNRTTLYQKMKKYGLLDVNFKEE